MVFIILPSGIGTGIGTVTGIGIGTGSISGESPTLGPRADAGVGNGVSIEA
ncbi:MAG TPA: hypothetical protein IAC35_01015 [Candidatus Cryptobacteroides merdipullorum]|uniref:Uncharacterized protein n=1 Tax=Candidatus Cryptobacteroides merdipullorum TaxID=2840771 RepID=A0A9D1KI58_9BACT|nr:hypothetical protein [Candidatus Cryptobacteroides merdipullorum]